MQSADKLASGNGIELLPTAVVQSDHHRLTTGPQIGYRDLRVS